MLRDRGFWLFAASWLAGCAVLAASGQPLSEPLFLLLILGLALPGLALLVCRGLPAVEPGRPLAGERSLLVALVVLVAGMLAVKGQLLARLVPAGADPRLAEAADLLFKLVLFVAIPLAAYRAVAGLAPRALGLVWPPGERAARRRSWLALLAVGGAFVAIQLGVGRGARPLLDGSLAERHWVLGIALCWLWMAVEAGVVEEVFFRAVLQSRLAALTGSQLSGLFLSALVFGLAHAPGLWLRGAGAIEGLDSPSLALSLAYSLTTMGVAGLVFGVLWLRTRNWLLVVVLHGLVDALSNAPRFMATWGL